MDTIFARASAPGKAGVAVFRVSGPQARRGVSALCKVPEAGRFIYSTVNDPSGETIDTALILFFEAGSSFTGDQTVEIQTHGSLAVEERLLNELSKVDGFRLAKPGEFTLRALLNQKMTLVEVEALRDLIESETDLQRQYAMKTSSLFKSKAESWRRLFLTNLALIEATIDFSEEEIPDDLLDQVRLELTNFVKDAEAVLDASKNSEILRRGFTVAIVGPPNIGKSTLINHIAGRDVAIVSDQAGTTRDSIEVWCDVKGLPVKFVDTAGLRETTDSVESLGIQKTYNISNEADLLIWLKDPKVQDDIAFESADLVFLGKGDESSQGLSVSGKTGFGVDVLLELVHEKLNSKCPDDGLYLNTRQSKSIENAVSEIKNVFYPDGTMLEAELASQNLKSALGQMDFLLGYIGVEDILGEIFGSFCIGK